MRRDLHGRRRGFTLIEMLAAISLVASVAFSPVTSGTGTRGGPALVTSATFRFAGASTPGGGSCQITVPAAADGWVADPLSIVPSREAVRTRCASSSGSPMTRGTCWWCGKIGAGNTSSAAIM